MANVELTHGLTLSHSAGFQRSLTFLALRTLPDFDCLWVWNFNLRGCQAAKPRAANAVGRTEFSEAPREMDGRACGSWPLMPVRAAWSLEADLLPAALTSRWGRGPWASAAHPGPGCPFRWSHFFPPSGHMNSLRLFRVPSKEAKALIH